MRSHIDLDNVATSRQSGPARTTDTQRDVAETTEAPQDHDADEVEYLEPPSSIPDLEAPDD